MKFHNFTVVERRETKEGREKSSSTLSTNMHLFEPEVVEFGVAQALDDDGKGVAEEALDVEGEKGVVAVVGDEDEDAAAGGVGGFGAVAAFDGEARGEFVAAAAGVAEEFGGGEELLGAVFVVEGDAVAGGHVGEGFFKGVEDDAAAEADDAGEEPGDAAPEAEDGAAGAAGGEPGEEFDEGGHGEECDEIERIDLFDGIEGARIGGKWLMGRSWSGFRCAGGGRSGWW